MEERWPICNMVTDGGKTLIVSGEQWREPDPKREGQSIIRMRSDRVLRVGETVYARMRVVGFDESGVWTGPVLATPMGRTKSLLAIHQYGVDPDFLATAKEMQAALRR